MKRLFIFTAGLLSFTTLWSQYGNFPLNNDLNAIYIGGMADEQDNYHPSLRPYEARSIDSLSEKLASWNFESESKAVRAIFNADTFQPKKDLIHMSLAPVINSVYSFGRSNDSTDTGHNLGIGLNLFGFITDKVTFGFEYTYSTNQYADYVENYIDEKGVIPGMGKASRRGDDYVNKFYSGYVSYDAAKFLNIQAGVGKHFIGNGYRSLLLSDNSFVYPYLRLTVDIWKIKYQVLYSFHDNLNYSFPNEVGRENRKYSTSNLLSMNFGKRVNIGLFQTVVWYDNEETQRGFDVNYANPIVFMRPVEFSVGSPDNILMGLDARYRFYKNYSLYAQVILDEFLLNEIRADSGWWGNKYGYQIGLKAHDAFGLKGFSFMLEHNWVRPFTYTHGNVYQNYGHYNEALAHTLGANFYDFIGQLRYVHKRKYVSFRYVWAKKGIDFPWSDDPSLDPVGDPTNYGGNIFRSNADQRMEYGNEIGQGWSTTRQFLELKAGYLISPDARWAFEIGVSQRKNTFEATSFSNEFTEENLMFHVGIKTLLHNQYFDF